MSSFNVEEGRDDLGLQPPTRRPEELWECQVKGRIWVEVTDHKGAPVARSVYGVGNRLRITSADRLLVQERIRERARDPFLNGSLLRVDADQQADPTTQSDMALSAGELELVFGLDEDDFTAFVREATEVNVRRLEALGVEVNAGNRHMSIIKEVLAERFGIGGSTPSNDEARSEGRSS